MNAKIRDYYLITGIISFFFYLFFCFYTFKPTLPPVENLPIFQEKEYVIKPVLSSHIWENVETDLPNVRISPSDEKYWLIQLREKFDLKMFNFDQLFFAEKRISELAKWGNILNQDQWEINLNTYSKLMYEYFHLKLLNLSEDQRYFEVISFYQKLNFHELKLKESVVNALFPLDIQKILNNKIFNIINSLKVTLVDNLENDDIKYSFAPIIDDKEFGTYSINDDQFIEITPDNPVKIYAVKYPSIPLEFRLDSFFEPDSENLLYKYQFQTNEVLLPDTKYLARITSSGERPFNLMVSQKINATQSAELFNQTIYPYEKRVTKTIVFTTPKSSTKLVYWPNIIVESKYPIPLSCLDSFDVTTQPVFDKELILTKINAPADYQPQISISKIGQNQYRVYYKNTTLDQDNFIKASLGFIWKIKNNSTNSFTVSIRLLPFLKYLAIFSFFIFIFFELIRSLISYLINIILKISQFFRFPILIISLVLIFFDIFFIPTKSSDIFIFFVVFFWSLFIIGFRVEARINFLFALIYLIICPVFIIFQKEIIVEKSAVWAYIMLVTGTVQSVIEIKLNLKNLYSPKQTFEIILESPFIVAITTKLIFVKSIVTKAQKKLLIIVTNIFLKIYEFIDSIINFKPVNFFELMFSLLKGLLIFGLLIYSSIIIVIIIFDKVNYFYIQYQKKVIMENRKKLYISRQPKINLIEPTLVYKATKIVIYGKDFGWDVKKAKALIDGKEIESYLWNDSKIIFPVPLEWKDGNHKIWIEKQIDWDGKKQKAKSEVFEIKILPITGSFTEDDKFYFEQIKTWKKETREVNGYK